MIELLIGMFVTVVGGIALYYWQNRIVERISVKRIKSSTHEYAEGLLDLYRIIFPDEEGVNNSLEEIIDVLNAKFEATHHVEVENITLAAVLRSEVVGFIFCHLYPQRRKAIISYFAIKKEIPAARLKAARQLLARLKDILVKGRLCDVLFYDLQGFDATTPRADRSERRARRVLFKQSASSFGLKAREFQFEYQCPKVSMSESAHEYPFVLFCIGINCQIPDCVPKQLMLDYLRFIYLDCYGDIYPVSDPRFQEHQAHLKTIVDRYEGTLPDIVQAT
ncbi:hypothetical protein [Candidatus Thiodictyon syntrophicum]|jgi:hypothetical protein|uniref:hypothetical protein n=1 Tax=Candidatus Thiodictyon syntrophicum TaxID=1166950 RepID=UPI0012FD5CEC|nr:hypothetical protein [Candidatus Thiodictyon syntrophicum]